MRPALRPKADADQPDIVESVAAQLLTRFTERTAIRRLARGEPKLPVSIGLIEDPAQQCSGPIWLRGGIALVSADGFEYEVRNRMTLCRCGESSNKPLYDGTHASINFKAR